MILWEVDVLLTRSVWENVLIQHIFPIPMQSLSKEFHNPFSREHRDQHLDILAISFSKMQVRYKLRTRHPPNRENIFEGRSWIVMRAMQIFGHMVLRPNRASTWYEVSRSVQKTTFHWFVFNGRRNLVKDFPWFDVM